MRPIGLDQGLGQRKADGRTVGGLLGRRQVAERLQGSRDFIVVEPGTGIADPQYHFAQIGQRRGNDDLAAGIGEVDRVADQIERDLPQRAGVGDHRRQRMRKRGADDDALAVGLRLHHRDAALDQIVEVLVGKGEVEPAGLDPRQLEQIVDDGDHMFARAADILQVFDIAFVAERAEPLRDHHFGKADDGIERRAHFMADPRQQVRFRVGRVIGLPPRRLRVAFALLALRQIAKHREEIRPTRTGPSDGHRQRDDAAVALAAEHVTAVIEQACDLGALDAGEMVLHHALAFRREQLGEMALRELRPVIAEQRFGAAIAGMDGAPGVEHHDAFGGGVENGGKILGIGVADRRRRRGWPRFRDRGHGRRG